MVDVDKLSDDELRTKLMELGFPLMPITGTTRKVMQKKLKLLLENKNKIDQEQRGKSNKQLGEFSSEEERSDTEAAPPQKDKRRITMAVPFLAPSASGRTSRRSASRLNDAQPEPPANNSLPKPAAAKKETTTKRNSTVVTTRTSKIVSNARQDYDTGSDSESDLYHNNTTMRMASQPSPSSPESPRPAATLKSAGSSFTSSTRYDLNSSPGRSSYGLGGSSYASDYVNDRLSQIRSRYSSTLAANSVADNNSEEEPFSPEETPYLSNFTKRLSALSASKNLGIKEHDVASNGSGAAASPSLYGTSRSSLSSSRFDSTRGRDAIYSSYGGASGAASSTTNRRLLRSNYVSFAVLAVAALFFVFLSIMYLGMHNNAAITSAAGVNVPYCKKGNIAVADSKKWVNCIDEGELDDALNLLNVLQPLLMKRAVAVHCAGGDDEAHARQPAHITETRFVEHVAGEFKIRDNQKIQRDLRNAQILAHANPYWRIRMVQYDAEATDYEPSERDMPTGMEEFVDNLNQKETAMVILEPILPWGCRIRHMVGSLLRTAFYLLLIFGGVFAATKAMRAYKAWRAQQAVDVEAMVQSIIDLVQSSAEEDKDAFVVVNHVRDTLIPIGQRKKLEGVWLKAVAFVQENESRVRSEEQYVQNEPYLVWRWIGSSVTSSPRNNKSWQGQAFETQTGSVNSLPCSPTPCLKIRGMVDDGDHRNTHQIREAVLGKCASQCRILHCDVDAATKCVYLKCAEQKDSAIAYTNLHGWWYAGNLVTVKYLRLERYMQRFPSSPSGPPYLVASSRADDWMS